MTIRRRRQTTVLDVGELEGREKWGGVLDGVPELTDAQRHELRHHHRETWVPHTALGYFWDTVDPNEGSWSLAGLLAALAEDGIEIEPMVAKYPEEGERLTKWRLDVERLGHERDVDDDVSLRRYYQRLIRFGYEGCRHRRVDDDAS